MKNPILAGLIMIIIAFILITIAQSKEIDTLHEKIEYQSNYIEDIDKNVLTPLGISNKNY